MNFFPQQLVTPSRQPKKHFPKIVDFTKRRNFSSFSWKCSSNAELLENVVFWERKTYKSAVSNKLIVNHHLAHFCFWQADLYRCVHYAFRNFFFSNIVFCYQKYATCCIGYGDVNWEHKVVLHYLINQCHFFLFNFWHHQDL